MCSNKFKPKKGHWTWCSWECFLLKQDCKAAALAQIEEARTQAQNTADGGWTEPATGGTWGTQ